MGVFVLYIERKRVLRLLLNYATIACTINTSIAINQIIEIIFLATVKLLYSENKTPKPKHSVII